MVAPLAGPALFALLAGGREVGRAVGRGRQRERYGRGLDEMIQNAIAGAGENIPPELQALINRAGAMRTGEGNQAAYEFFRGATNPDPTAAAARTTAAGQAATADIVRDVNDRARRAGSGELVFPGVSLDPNASTLDPTAQIQNYEYSQALPEEERANFMGMFRNPVQMVAGVPHIQDASGNLIPMGDAAAYGQRGGEMDAAQKEILRKYDAQVQAGTMSRKGARDLALIETAMNHPGLERTYGMYSLAPTRPGSASADFQALLEQVKGGAFLQGVQELRGTGPVSDREGGAVVAAATRVALLDQSSDAAKQAWQDLFDKTRSFYEAVERERGMTFTPTGASTPTTPGEPSIEDLIRNAPK